MRGNSISTATNPLGNPRSIIIYGTISKSKSVIPQVLIEVQGGKCGEQAGTIGRTRSPEFGSAYRPRRAG